MAKLHIPDNVETFGEALYWARKERGLTMRALAKLIGVSPPFMCDLEHDRRTTSRVAQFAKALDVHLADLERRQGMSQDLHDWLSHQPKLLARLRDIRAKRCTKLVLK